MGLKAGMLYNIETLAMETQILEDHALELGQMEDPGGLLDEGYPKYFGNPVHSVPSSPNASPFKTEEIKTETSKTAIKNGPEETTHDKKDVTWSTTLDTYFTMYIFMFKVCICKKLEHVYVQSHQA